MARKEGLQRVNFERSARAPTCYQQQRLRFATESGSQCSGYAERVIGAFSDIRYFLAEPLVNEREMPDTTIPMYRSEILKRMDAGERQEKPGAIEGTRTPTPLRVHGPEPCASANSATMAIVIRLQADPCRRPFQERTTRIFYRRLAACQTLEYLALGFRLRVSYRSLELRQVSNSSGESRFSILEPEAGSLEPEACAPQPLNPFTLPI